MHRRKVSELLLAVIAGPERSAAMYGDLLELEPQRGKLWFWGAYLRTLLVCGWKIPLALVAAVAVRQLVFELFHVYLAVTPESWRSTDAPFLLGRTGPLLACIMSTLWFLLPYSAVLYGIRHRVVRLTLAISAGATIAFMCLPWLSAVAALLTAILAGAAVASRVWRGAAIALLIMGAAGVGMMAISGALAMFLQSHNLAAVSTAAHLRNAGFQADLLLLAVLCSGLHQGWGKSVFSHQPS